MDYKEIGSTGIKVSAVGFGGLQIPKVDRDQAVRTIRHALECGINFFETGPRYGKGISEDLIGEALVERRNEVVLANKTYAYKTGSGESVVKAIHQSLERQRTDYFDVFSFWGINNQDQFDEVLRSGIFDSLSDAKRDGLIRAIGVTTHAQPREIVDFVARYRVDCVTLKYNILTRRMEETIAVLHEKGIGVVVMTPLAGGMVAKPGGDVESRLEQQGIDPAVLGLRYLTSNPAITSAISGMCHPDEVDVNVSAGNTEPLTPVEAETVAYVQEKMKRLGEVFCTSCGYCMPCPENVGIPSIFRLWNIMRGFGAASYSETQYQQMNEGSEFADFKGNSAEHCVQCGLCETRCPERLPIMEDLKRAHADMTPTSLAKTPACASETKSG